MTRSSWISRGKDCNSKLGERYDAHREWQHEPERRELPCGDIVFDGLHSHWISIEVVQWRIGRQLQPGECVEVVSSEVMG